ncbi:MAG: deoxyribodipyrimidine photo-lyase [Planctomycetota bacterium]
MRPLVWFRADLRTKDNTALSRATRAAKRGVVGVFLIAADQWREHDWAAVKVDFLLRSLEELKGELKKINVPLLIRRAGRFDDAAVALTAIADEHGCDALYFNEEYEVNEKRRDTEVTEAFAAAGRAVHGYTDQVVLAPGQVLTKTGGWYGVYSPFKRRWHAALDEEGGIWTEPEPKKQPALNGLAADDVPQTVKPFALATHERSRFAALWPAGEREARKALGSFCKSRIAGYKDNRDTPSVPGTSSLSHHLAVGTISPRQCIAKAADANDGEIATGNAGVVGWIEEVIWREFYKHLIVGHPRLCMHRPFQLDTDRITWRDDDDHFAAWAEGRTGYPIIDAAMRQLNETGWMHNRLRMIVASFFTKNLFLDWRRGERYFMTHLIDGDLASNNGGWQWSASTGTDAQPYFRVFNPISQSEKFDPDGEFIRRYVPELEDAGTTSIHDPAKLAKSDLFSGTGYPKPIVDAKSTRVRAIDAFKELKSA